MGDPVGSGQYAIAFRPDDEKLAGQIDAALLTLLENGELQRIYEKWNLWNDQQQ